MQTNQRELLIAEIQGKNSFLKVKPDALKIGKVLFAFVEYDKDNGNKIKKSIDIYMSIADALVLAYEILNGTIESKAAMSYGPSDKYPPAFWTSKLGGIKEETVKKRGLRTDGKAISRCFSISVGALMNDGNRNPYVLTAISKPGSTNAYGLIVPDKGAKGEYIRVPVLDKNVLTSMALEIISWNVAQHTKDLQEVIHVPTQG